ncbi:hypothetical protein B0H14DRAFT_2613233 [Mycena olivaceomarginata]|nr:hypothetical protein B0H14DRAFT_2613233 [Mycena olivaceomarginata]
MWGSPNGGEKGRLAMSDENFAEFEGSWIYNQGGVIACGDPKRYQARIWSRLHESKTRVFRLIMIVIDWHLENGKRTVKTRQDAPKRDSLLPGRPKNSGSNGCCNEHGHTPRRVVTRLAGCGRPKEIKIRFGVVDLNHGSAAPPRVAGPFNNEVAPVDKLNSSYGRGVLAEGFSFWKKVTRKLSTASLLLTISRIGWCGDPDTQGIPVAGGICLPGKKGKGRRLSVEFDITEDLTMMSLAGRPNIINTAQRRESLARNSGRRRIASAWDKKWIKNTSNLSPVGLLLSAHRHDVAYRIIRRRVGALRLTCRAGLEQNLPG